MNPCLFQSQHQEAINDGFEQEGRSSNTSPGVIQWKQAGDPADGWPQLFSNSGRRNTN